MSAPAPPRIDVKRWAWPATVAVALAFGAWGVWAVLAPNDQQAWTRALERQAKAQRELLARLQQQVSTLTRSDQISREANRELQGTLAERDEEIAALRADVAFYERLVGATGQRRGLTVHSLRLESQNGQAWHFTATLTQNLNRGAVSRGQVTLALEGSRNGRLQRLDWNTLRQQPRANGLAYSFKYFQQVEGDLLLPAGLTPVRVIVRLTPAQGAPVEQSFTWAEATAERDGAPARAP